MFVHCKVCKVCLFDQVTNLTSVLYSFHSVTKTRYTCRCHHRGQMRTSAGFTCKTEGQVSANLLVYSLIASSSVLAYSKPVPKGVATDY